MRLPITSLSFRFFATEHVIELVEITNNTLLVIVFRSMFNEKTTSYNVRETNAHSDIGETIMQELRPRGSSIYMKLAVIQVRRKYFGADHHDSGFLVKALHNNMSCAGVQLHTNTKNVDLRRSYFIAAIIMAVKERERHIP